MLNYLRVLFLLLIITQQAFSQCMMVPIGLTQRVQNSSTIVLGKLKEKYCYWDAGNANIYTANIIEITAYLKGHSSNKNIALIAIGGEVDDDVQISTPTVELQPGAEYVLMLENDNALIDNKSLRSMYPGMVQATAYASTQGRMTLQNGYFYDLLSERPQTEVNLLYRIKNITGLNALTPEGNLYQPKTIGSSINTKSITNTKQAKVAGITAVTSLSPTTTLAGTINTSDYITITGSGFGATTGNVYFKNADDGGATYISSSASYSTEIVSWADGSITAKVPSQAGTGTVQIVTSGGTTYTSASTLTITYALKSYTTTVAGYASATRQRLYLRNKNNFGGYTFTYNTTFNSNSSAVTAFENALKAWRCATYVNFDVDKSSTTSISTAANDGVNVVTFDATLATGVLGLATSRLNGAGNGTCNQANTVLYINEVDVQFATTPSTGFSWYYGTGTPTSTQYDLESVAIHELGHAHNLGHVINSGKIMHYSLSNGSKIRTLTSTIETAGGLAVMNYSTTATCYNPSGSGTQMVAISSGACTSLPITLLSFSGKQSNSSNQLSWSAADEEEHSAYELMRSEDGIIFESIYSTDALYKGGVSEYNYIDATASTNKTYYYKLKLIDEHEGHEHDTYSNIIEVGSNTAFLEIFYDLTNKDLVIHKENVDASITVFDLTGKSILTLLLNEEFMNVSMTNTKPGIYTYLYTSAGTQKHGKIIVQ